MALTRVSFTARGAGALVGALLVFLLAFYTTNILLFLVSVFLLALVLGSLLTFAFATRGFGPDAFVVERVESSSLVKVQGAGFLSVRVTSRLPTGFYAELYDAHSERLKILEGSDRLVTWWSARETLSLAYVVSPDLRGLLEVGPTVVIAHDIFGLAHKSVQLDDRWAIEALVQPTSVPLGHPVRLASTVVGQTSLSARGSGSDFRGLREYEAHDEMRHIAWTRSGQGTLYVREYERESQQDLLVLLDVGRGMAMGSGYANALEDSIDGAARVLRLAFDEGGRGGLLVFGDDVKTFVPPGRGSGHEFLVLRALTGATVSGPPSSLGGALRYLLPQLKRPATFLVFSAPGDDVATLGAQVAGLRQAGHRFYAIVPDVEGMYGELPGATDQQAFRTILEPAIRRTRALTEELGKAGVSVGLYGRGGAVETVARLYARDQRSPGWT
jgi:uncharacterized protein (DUF58 family)